MTLTHTSSTGSKWEAKFNRDLDIEYVYRNGEKVKLPNKVNSWKKDIIWNAFNKAFDLDMELREYYADRFETV